MKTLRAGALGGLITAGVIVVTAGAASAWTGGVTVGPPTCLTSQGGTSAVSVAHVTVANHEDTPAMMQTTSDVQMNVPAHGTVDFVERTNGQTTHVRLTWFGPDGQRLDKWDSDYTLPKRSSDACEQPTTTTAPAPTTVPAPTTTTTIVCLDGGPPSVHLEDGSVVCPEYGAPEGTTTTTSTAPPAPAIVRQAPPRAPTVATTAPALPATGKDNPGVKVAAGVLLALLGVGLVLLGRTRHPSKVW